MVNWLCILASTFANSTHVVNSSIMLRTDPMLDQLFPK